MRVVCMEGSVHGGDAHGGDAHGGDAHGSIMATLLTYDLHNFNKTVEWVAVCYARI